jgi:alcohol dehydrogenase class IV
MDSFVFQAPGNIVFGSGAIEKIADIVTELSAARVLLVTDRGVRNAGLTRDIETNLSAAHHEVIIFDEVVADPPAAVIERAVDAGRAAAVDLVLGVGGGSSLDTAKLVSYLIVSADRLDDLYGVGRARSQRLPLILVPTTAGTGSEVTPIAIVTTGTDEKKGVISARLLPDYAVLDPKLTLALPRALTAWTGIDAMVHAIEAYTSKHRKNPLSDQFARQALALLSRNIRNVCAQETTIAARTDMLMGSMLAGMAFANAPVAAVHALAYPIGARFHVPHGLSNALVLLPVLRFNLPAAAALYAELAPILNPYASGSSVDKAKAFIASLASICRDCGVPHSLQSAGVARDDLACLAAEAMKQTRLLVNNPREVTTADALALYTQAYEGATERAPD